MNGDCDRSLAENPLKDMDITRLPRQLESLYVAHRVPVRVGGCLVTTCSGADSGWVLRDVSCHL